MTVWRAGSKLSVCSSDAAERSGQTCVCKTDCIEQPIRRYFYRHGGWVSSHPWMFFLLPLVVSACLGFGLKYFQLETDTEYLVTPKNGEAKAERRVILENFDLNQTHEFLPERGAVLDGFLDVIIASPDGGHVLTPSKIAAIHKLDDFIRNIWAKDDIKVPYTYESICGLWQKKCSPQILLEIYSNASLADQVPLTYPWFGNHFLGSVFGNVTVDNVTGRVLEARAARLIYFVRYESDTDQEFANRWFTAATAALQTYLQETGEKEIEIFHCATNSLANQFDQASEDIVPRFAAPFSLLIIFSVVSCMMNDWVRSKPWLALVGVISAGLSLLSVFGLLSALGVRAVPQVGLVPFLILGVGVDNMFILISAWRRSEGVVATMAQGSTPRDRVRARLSAAMQEAALSITITSLTDVLAFGIGAITEFRTVELFCLYTGLCITFSYVYCITFFAAAMVFSGWREETNRHCFLFIKVKPAAESGLCYGMWCAGGRPADPEAPPEKVAESKGEIVRNKAEAAKFLEATSGGGAVCGDPWKTQAEVDQELAMAAQAQTRDHMVMRVFRDYIGPFLMKKPVKAVVVLLYVVYCVIAIYGCTGMRKGVAFKKLSNSDSYLEHYYTQKDNLFNQYGPSVALVLHQPLNYSEPQVQSDIEDMIRSFEEEDAFFSDIATVSWLRVYKQFLQHWPVQPQNETQFVQILRDYFLTSPGMNVFRPDLTFAGNDSDLRISACRFYVQSTWFEGTEETMLAARRIARRIEPFSVTIFHQTFVYFDQPVVVWANTLQNMIIAVICMFFVALLFVPHILCALWVTAAAASIEIGVIGCMTLWDVNVDFVTMTFLILCIGFSVDFAVHITYGFIASTKTTPNEKAIDALYIIGYPILQSGTSTMIGIVFLCTSISYLFLSFFKTMILVILFGIFHGIIFLPVFLSLLSCKVGPCPKEDCEEEISKQRKHLQEKSRHICPGLFADCKDCQDTESTREQDLHMWVSVV